MSWSHYQCWVSKSKYWAPSIWVPAMAELPFTRFPVYPPAARLAHRPLRHVQPRFCERTLTTLYANVSARSREFRRESGPRFASRLPFSSSVSG